MEPKLIKQNQQSVINTFYHSKTNKIIKIINLCQSKTCKRISIIIIAILLAIVIAVIIFGHNEKIKQIETKIE